MAFDFPSAPASGAEYTSGGVTYVWNGTGWTVKAAAGGDFVLKTGDVMTGNLAISTASAAAVALNKAVGSTCYMSGAAGGNARWLMSPGDMDPEGGSNTGSNFSLERYNDAGVVIDTPLKIYRDTGVTQMVQGLTWGASGESILKPNGSAFINSSLAITNPSGNNYPGLWLTRDILGNDTGVSLIYDVALNVANFYQANTTTPASPFNPFALHYYGTLTAGQSKVKPKAGEVTCSFMLQDAAGAYQGDLSFNGAGLVLHAPTIITFGIDTPTPINPILMTNIAVQFYNGANNWQENGNIVIGNEGYKLVAGPWAAMSDARIKTVNGPYTQGLDALKQINPVRFEFKGNVTTQSQKAGEEEEEPFQVHKNVLGKEFIGLVAQDVETPMPEMVSQTVGIIDGQPVNDLRTLDITALTYALINAVKELSAKVDALEAQLNPARR